MRNVIRVSLQFKPERSSDTGKLIPRSTPSVPACADAVTRSDKVGLGKTMERKCYILILIFALFFLFSGFRLISQVVNLAVSNSRAE